MRYIIILSLFIFSLLLIGFSGSRVTNLSVATEGRDITISWEMLDQIGVRHFNVERRTADQENFTQINNNPIERNDSKKYEYVDRGVYKQDNAIVFYRVAIVEINGGVYYSDIAPLGKISSVRRTWGSIKSMFR